MRLAILATALAATAAAVPALADPIKDAIDARRGYFTLLGANIGPLAAMAKGEADYDAAVATLHAQNLAQLAGYDPLPHFPAASSNDDRFGDTRALPAIWSDGDGFKAKLADFAEAAAAMPSVAGAGRAELGQAVGRLGGTCKACHDDYRAKDF